MAFASCYSIRKWLPDCKVHIKMVLDRSIFNWAPRLGVGISISPEADVEIPPTTMVLRDFFGDTKPASSKSNDQSSFVDYSEGCGNFVVDEWINNHQVPFHKALRRFGTPNLTVNEVAILNFWERCGDIYKSVGG
jgi:hypothetical protein